MNRYKLRKWHMRGRATCSGFTLLDVLIALAILAIFTAIALPGYESFTDQGRRAEAVNSLQQIMQHQERFFLNNLTYTTTIADLGFIANPLEYYNITAGTCDGGLNIARCVELTATPIAGHAGDGNITLNSLGEQGATGDAAAANVWGH